MISSKIRNGGYCVHIILIKSAYGEQNSLFPALNEFVNVQYLNRYDMKRTTREQQARAHSQPYSFIFY